MKVTSWHGFLFPAARAAAQLCEAVAVSLVPLTVIVGLPTVVPSVAADPSALNSTVLVVPPMTPGIETPVGSREMFGEEMLTPRRAGVVEKSLSVNRRGAFDMLASTGCTRQ